MTDPFAAYQQQTAPAPAPAPTQQAPVPPAPAPMPAPDPSQIPVGVDPQQFAAYQAFLAAQQTPAAPAPVAPPAAVYAPPVQQQVAPTAPVQPAPVAQPPAGYPAPAGLAPTFTPPPGPAPATAAPTLPASGSPDDLFDDPSPQRPKGPRLREMYGRLVVLVPKDVEKVDRKREDGSTYKQNRMTADVIVLDGGPIAYGGTPEKPPFTPHDKVAQVPHREVNMYVSAVALISQCDAALQKRRNGQPGMTIGRLSVGQQQGGSDRNPPWILLPATPEDKALAAQYVQQLAADIFA